MSIARATELHAETVLLHRDAVRRHLSEWAGAYWRRLRSLRRMMAVIEWREKVKGAA